MESKGPSRGQNQNTKENSDLGTHSPKGTKPVHDMEQLPSFRNFCSDPEILLQFC